MSSPRICGICCLQPPIRNHRVLALDPGYKSGCKYTALDQFGNLLEHGVIFLIGKPDRREQSKQKIVEVIKKYQITVVAIGNGTACREVEKFVAGDVLGGELTEQGVAYVIVNEAGASVYSTSRLGREEFPDYDATLRGAISIGRRLQDPLERTGEDRAGQHRRGPVSARREGQALERLAR